MHRERFYTLSASCPDRVGIVAKVSGFIAEHKGWILETSLHAEPPLDAGEVARWMLHCHHMPHLETGMMTEFAVNA